MTARTQFRLDPMDQLDLIASDASASIRAPMNVTLDLDLRDGSLDVTYHHQSDNAVPISVWHGLIRQWPIPITADAAQLTAAINAGKLDTLLTRLLKGADIHRDQQSNLICSLSEDAESASEAVQQWLYEWSDTLPGDAPGFWEAGDWLVDGPESVEGLTATTTDEELQTIADRLEAEARAECVVLDGLSECLVEFRNRLRES